MSVEAMEQELDWLIGVRERAVGMSLKRTNFRISELQKRIDHAKGILSMDERSAPATLDCDHQPQGSQPD